MATSGPEPEPQPEPQSEPEPEPKPEPEPEPEPDPEPELEPEPELTQSLGTDTSGSTAEVGGLASGEPPEATSRVEDVDPDLHSVPGGEPNEAPDTSAAAGLEATPRDHAQSPTEEGAAPDLSTTDLDTADPNATDPNATVLRNRHETARQHTRNFLSCFAATIAVGLVAYTFWVGLWSWPFGSDASHNCARGTPIATAAPIKQTAVRVYNATDRRGLALSIARELQKRGFMVPMWDNDTGSPGMTAAAEIRHGPDALLPARTIAAQINGSTVLVLKPERQGPTIDLVLGQAFAGLNSPEKASELMAPPPVTSDTCDTGGEHGSASASTLRGARTA